MGQSTLPDEAVTPSMDFRLQVPLMGNLPPSPPLPPPQLVQPLLMSLPGQAGIFLAGFKDCTEEAIKYLVDVEQIPEHDPLILGLKQHLWERQFNLDLAKVISSSEDDNSSEDTMDNAIENNNPGAQMAQTQNVELSESNGNVTVVPQESSGMEQQCETNIINEASSSSNNNSTSSSNNNQSNSVLGDNSGQASVSGSGSQVEDSSSSSSNKDSLSPTELLTLSVLAQNNPAIASLTQELFDLLDGDEDEDADANAEAEDEEAGSSMVDEAGEREEEDIEADDSMDAEHSPC